MFGSRSTPRRLLAALGSTVLIGLVLTILITMAPSVHDDRHARSLFLAIINKTTVPVSDQDFIYGWPYALKINEPETCKNQDVYLLNAVTSNPSQVYHRELIRKMWGRKYMARNLKIRTVFIVGTIPSQITQKHLTEESTKYRDIIQFDFLETRKNLTIKSLAAVHWFRAFCPNATWILKSDVDAYINFWALIEVLRPLNNTKDAVCARSLSRTVCREVTKWGCYEHYVVSRDEYPDDVYPPYCQGYSYILHSDFADKMLEQDQKRTKPPFWLEDVYVTGLLTRHLNPRWFDVRRQSEVVPEILQPEYYNGTMLFIHDLDGQIGQGATLYVWNKTLEHYNVTTLLL
ncbi:beta-1,3-galactosyltransferase 5-like [Macrobrachium rosenbergii]|uniref:beta-1,3-galactosyltransferase 5-like n=1 Tax=Macrobrachium rosenbergii TaxID=79674 RepID=UPI0034D79A2B